MLNVDIEHFTPFLTCFTCQISESLQGELIKNVVRNPLNLLAKIVIANGSHKHIGGAVSIVPDKLNSLFC